MTLNDRIDVLAELGRYLLQPPDAEMSTAMRRSLVDNGWFTEANQQQALHTIATSFLDRDRLAAWAAEYSIGGHQHPRRTIGVIMAGNVPLVGFHDWLCIFIAGERAKVKLSEKDRHLLPLLVSKIGEWEHEAWEYTEFAPEGEPLRGFDAVVATGSNNTARYFEQYFSRYPHIIRRNRNAVAALSGAETMAELYALGRDVFGYFGLGCRNVSKLYVPHGYRFEALLEALHEYRDLILHHKYKNNFDYNFTLLILNHVPHMNNGCVLLHESPAFSSRIASLHYEYYADLDELDELLASHRDDIQCVASNLPLRDFDSIPFGKTQEPTLADYPDAVDVMKFVCGHQT
ncbi:MAG TPA: acyl-CoA reductase [Saprospiraceae bacterium]|nr:acyl-CoA reductase [Saprospiraceae bacterium]HND87684.1 acyl-CoA reductase [Saprospiraceae bacterium]